MFFMLFILFLMGGSICILLPVLMPDMFMWIVFMGMIIMGLMMIWTGCLIYAGRSVSTGGYLLNEMAKPNEVLTLHERRGGQGKLRRGTLEVLEHIKLGKDMLFKDTGGGIRVAGHRIVKTVETVNHNIPDWIAQYLHQVKIKYMVDDMEKIKILHTKLKALQKPIPGVMTIEDQLKAIPELNVIMQDPKLKLELINMNLKDLQQMSELMYDGEIIHYEDYEKFQQAAAPYDMQSYTNRKGVQIVMEMIHFRDVNAPDWMKYGVMILLVCIGGFFILQAVT
jgi:hypothetical protein